MEQDELCRPVPAPRRLYPELRKSEYENVTIDLINKNLNINTENIHNLTNCADKLPNNKVFLGALTEEETSTNNKSILTETNDLYGPDCNENVPIDLYTTPTPVPRPRKPQNSDNPTNNEDIYENSSSNAVTIPNNAGAISKSLTGTPILRKAPELPPKSVINVEQDKIQSRHSICSELSTTSSCNNAGSYNLGDSHFSNSKAQKSASNGTLNSSFDDSTGSSEGSKKEFKSPSPGYVEHDSDEDISFDSSATDNELNVSDLSSNNTNDLVVNSATNHENFCNDSDTNDLLKSLGVTSKLLTESIGERVASRAKGAKHKLDKNLKSSTELLSNLGTETSQRIKTASKRLGVNFTLNKKEKFKDKDKMPTQYNSERPQTLPPNDSVFHTISFNSPLQKKADGINDLSVPEEDEHSYEVPRSLKVAHNTTNLTQPPTYEDALKATPSSSFQRNIPMSRSLILPKHISEEAANIALSKQRSNVNLNKVVEENSMDSSDAASRDSIDVPSLPMPAFPPPALPKEVTVADNVYGKLNSIQPPIRQKRRKNYEEIQLRRAPAISPSSAEGSLRPNVDSAELQQLNLEEEESAREESLFLRERIKSAEARTPKPERSDSWEYFADTGNDSDTSSSEPVYANQEATYGKVFEMETSISVPLPPKCKDKRIETSNESSAGAVGGWVMPSREVIQEFDPLMLRKSSTIYHSDKSNELLLLEHLLEEETYGTVTRGKSKYEDDVSVCTSEEENLNTTANSAAQLPLKELMPQTVVLPTPSTSTAKKSSTSASTSTSTSTNQMKIVHQNAQLLSESAENILEDNDEEQIKTYLSRVEQKKVTADIVDLSKPTQNRTNWFVNENKENGSQARINPFNKMNIEGGESPPSYLEAIGADGKPSNLQKSIASRLKNSMNVFTNVKIRVDALKRKSSFKVAQRESEVKVTLQMVPRPSLSPLLVRYEGPLIRFPSGVVEDILKEMQNRKAILRDRQFQTFLDQDMKTPKEIIPLEYITTLQCVSNNRVTDNSTHFYCFEITTSVPKNGSNSASNVQAMSNPNLIMTTGNSGNCKQIRISHLYGVSKESERGVWMQKLLESLTNAIPPKYICHYYRAGWCYLKNSITSEWSGTWLVLKKSRRRLVFVSESTLNVEKMDLRKARCIVLKDSDETIKKLHVESGPTLMIDCPPFTVYMIMSSPRETKIWRHIIREVAHNNGFSLSDQQLTKFNVPVIVDKCINFVYIHGSMSEGIYRKSGSENSIVKLMSAFRTDAFNVEITRNEYNEHDVANVLKRFMRDLPERLLGKLSESFICVTELAKPTEKIEVYKELLQRLGTIERETLKKIVSHLAFISSQKSKNKMSVQNLTMIWGPTLLHSRRNEELVYSTKEADVLTDLVLLYKNLFPLSVDEMKKEQEMLLCLQKYYAAAETLMDSVKKSGDLKMWITLNPSPENLTEEKKQINVTISPTKTAYEICQELAPKMNMSTHQVSLHEIILNDNLERPLHHDTKVFEVVLNWSYWPEDDRKNNYLVVKPVDLLREVDRAVKNLATVTPGKELKFADNRTKSFKSYQCELRDGKIVVSKKDKNDKTTIVREIFLHSSTAYLGCEKKRDFPWSWAITFVERNQTQILRSRDLPYIGHVLAGSEWVDRTIWYSSIWYCLYGDSILPPAEIILK
ncbi:uncharacterized protein LOC119668963 isoform X1 [Teleopsis dalmanni]|uniref:uncharacterized protein LOC119668963 isoform X1 n=1 Tax=Teleopsis dalmanni TaxID=139649 RepID=UPI0018CEEBAB|nr:uncharacterized protein LOC119668963 isoform X1 [Teleopsis dalmanni]